MPKLTKKLRVGLTLLAGVMPETTENFREIVTGRQLLAENVTHLASGKKVQPGGLYGRFAQRAVNHARRLCGAFARAGRAGVLAYCTPHIEPQHLALFSTRLSELVPAE